MSEESPGSSCQRTTPERLVDEPPVLRDMSKDTARGAPPSLVDGMSQASGRPWAVGAEAAWANADVAAVEVVTDHGQVPVPW